MASKFIWCARCGQEKGKLEGTRLVWQGLGNEPSEYERVTWGRAKKPEPEERYMILGTLQNQVKLPLPKDFFLCDMCNAEIRPGESCMGWSIWREDMTEPEAWEDRFLERTQ